MHTKSRVFVTSRIAPQMRKKEQTYLLVYILNLITHKTFHVKDDGVFNVCSLLQAGWGSYWNRWPWFGVL